MSRGISGLGGGSGLTDKGISAVFGAATLNTGLTSILSTAAQIDQQWLDLDMKKLNWSAETAASIKPPPISG